ncbi:amino acid/amide ABC transporter substrate-binding protein (HAAT family) [Arthrobacter sp. AG258]|uniref:ABC transporter substrate-binding protein n=1 Tax=Arthrobacter sp. AG258 TaxID=2183899 RepID=UPI001061854C|nr:ABC transporter substrate-binding protein [Arthrobacter sp. AG258]TDT76257.1 amino acid/amide ABC transporter substrate-binding protein (HAAT family) [Arthrobacter sp. AG258]
MKPKHRPAVRTALAVSLAAVLGATACSGTGGNARVESAEASGDGVLRVGLVLDNTGGNAFLNQPQLAAAKLAVQDINAAGGHKGRPVELLPAHLEQDTAGQAKALLAAKADVVIGPTDSSHAEAAVGVLSGAHIPLISPANTAAGLTGMASGGYYFRTAAADVAQGPVLAKLAKDAGAATVSVLYQEGTYGKDLQAAVTEAAKQSGLTVLPGAGFTTGDAAAASSIAKAKPDAVVLIAREGAQGALAALNGTGVGGSRIVMSDGAFARYGSGLGSKVLDGARAVVPGQLPSAAFQQKLLAVDPSLKDVSYAAETYDAVTLAALAAARAQDDAGRSIAANLIPVSGGTAAPGAGTAAAPCVTYKACLGGLAAGPDINYDGESGPIAFDANGDITVASFSVFTYGPDDLPTPSGRETAGHQG